jgi:Ni/Fe-hydrogenase 1 B-type cytochrome subunit
MTPALLELEKEHEAVVTTESAASPQVPGAHAPGAPSVEYRRVYVWEIPVRIYHWINAVALVLLCVTGYLIGAPQRVFTSPEAYQQYWFGTVRFLHFTAGFVYFFNTLARVYWAFVGNKHSRWNVYIPLKKGQWKEMWNVLLVDVLQIKKHAEFPIGHNAVAAFCYLFTFLAFIAQTVTGFALYASMSNSWFPKLFTWIVPILGGEMAVRYWHHWILWFFVSFIVVHVYLSFYHDYIEGRGTISAIIGGWKFGKEEERGK